MSRRNKRPPDPRGVHVRIYWDMIDSPAWRAMGYPSQALYVVLRRKLMSTNNGNISAAMGDLKHYGWKSSATLARALRELVAMGFIAVTRQGGIAYGRQVCTLYRFTDEQTFELQKLGIKASDASNDWKHFTDLKQACMAIREAHQNAKRAAPKNKSGLQNMKRYASENEALSRFNASESEAVAVSLLQKVKRCRTPRIAANPH